jgi:hypothetical protein
MYGSLKGQRQIVRWILFKFNYSDIHFKIQESIYPQSSNTLQFVEVTFC